VEDMQIEPATVYLSFKAGKNVSVYLAGKNVNPKLQKKLTSGQSNLGRLNRIPLPSPWETRTMI